MADATKTVFTTDPVRHTVLAIQVSRRLDLHALRLITALHQTVAAIRTA